MQTHNVSSSAIKTISYDESTQVMQITFTSQNQPYDFCNVPKHVFEGLLNASSKGTYYNTYIRDKYQCV